MLDVKSGRRLRTLKRHDGLVTAIAQSPDGSLLATGATSGTVRFWNARNGKEVGVLSDQRGPVAALAFAPAGNLLSVAWEDMGVRLWNTTTVGL